MNWHQLIDERSYEMHQVIAAALRHDPSKLTRVVEWIENCLADPDYSIHSKDALHEWLNVIEQRGVDGVIEALEDRGENATRMRQSSPFAVLMPQKERMNLKKQLNHRDTKTQR